MFLYLRRYLRNKYIHMHVDKVLVLGVVRKTTRREERRTIIEECIRAVNLVSFSKRP